MSDKYILLEQNLFTKKELKSLDECFFKELSQNYGLNFLDLNKDMKFEKYLDILPIALMEQYELFCFNEDDENIYIVSFKPLLEEAIEKIQNLYRFKNIQIFICTYVQFEYFFKKIQFLIKIRDYADILYKNLNNQEVQEDAILEQFLLLILSHACFFKASDIHFEPLENEVLVRFRIDGILNNICVLNFRVYQALLLHIKIISLLNVAEQRNAQDGSFSKIILEQKYDFRVSIMPLLFGQSIVLRILKQEERVFELDKLFIDEDILSNLKRYIQAPYGLILFCGPTGSGKSTFMHAILNQLDTSKKIITLEDPIEYKLKHAQQILLNPKANFDFHKALRSVLRQDPDVIMVGEIRDEESLDIVLKASLSGHLVLSTLHTNNALEAIFRMMHMNAKSYLISCSLNLIIAQRLVRKLCKCKEKVYEKSIFQNEVIEGYFYKAKGCARCLNSGYKGRIMIAEFLFLDQNIKNMIENNIGYDNILKYAIEKGFLTLGCDAVQKVKQGLTSLEELKKISF
ncbi:transformation system, type II secretion system ATPase CtsE [Campylobacter sp. RM16704]|uniref:transformation system, type II secretion system ATPase CtsE n=1 Tax=Campylobacter sp. RM16704 TaxID=1500960 RepID=UPI00057D6C6B|nr:transformation system, type II secretion system ATPase CtsE [Campylobacter sp. RM16704]AJC85910.1 transformation system, type II secretion system ATPase CtsE [Campylobacter sp. RM16704]